VLDEFEGTDFAPLDGGRLSERGQMMEFGDASNATDTNTTVSGRSSSRDLRGALPRRSSRSAR
jgi:hypothetical protein